MVKKEIKFSDGTRIFYEEENGILRRFIEYAYTPYEIAKIEEDPDLEKWFKKRRRKLKADKYYYLEILWNIACVRNNIQRQQLYDELKELHDKVGTEYDDNIISKDFLDTFGKYWEGEEVICAAFFTIIYLDMLDHENGRITNPNSLGKTKVLNSCEAVILKGMNVKDAATMIEMEFKDIIDNAIRTEEIVEMEYSKDRASNKFYQLCNIRYSDDYGERCFCGCPISSETELTFRFDRIKNIQLMWNFIFEENIPIEKDGIYALSFMGDNYIEFGLYSCYKCSYLLNYYKFDLIDLLAYHYIPFYSGINNKQWYAFDKKKMVTEDSIYVFAYTIESGTSVDLEEPFDFLLKGDSFKTTENSGILYTAIRVRKGESFETTKINKGINILAYSKCYEFTSRNLGVHNDIRLGIKP